MGKTVHPQLVKMLAPVSLVSFVKDILKMETFMLFQRLYLCKKILKKGRCWFMSIKKLLFSGVSLVFAAALIPLTVFASPHDGEMSNAQFQELKQKALNAAQNYVSIVSQNGSYSPWLNTNITYQFPLFDFEDDVTSFLFDVDNDVGDAGYLVVSADDSPVVIEATREGNSPYLNKSKNEKAVYVGPTQYYIKKSNDVYYDIRKKTEENKSNFKSKGTLDGTKKVAESELVSETALSSKTKPGEISTMTIVNYSSRTISEVPDFTWRKGCSPTSFSNIIWYYRYSQGYTGLLQSTTTPETLIDVLASSTYMNTGTNGGTGWDNRVTGMVKFWSDRGYTVSVTRNSPSFSEHMTEINNGRPDI
ncbi:hypothetical protein GE107_07065 [Cohnella sp. CFH 77786]|uniref:hypothetical protein n=1 Tax=Cohnella sp. CFH 77786 TaxID=2662265 RepID=UPI001C60C155|nr:hypothetical protein [Cohnella sp. CFH 77786]MBW5445819.1 hypothetical protein [Cohnella sp. CFH 77786]